MPKRRYEQREPTHDWQPIRSLLKDSAQITYEVIRPVIFRVGDAKGALGGNRHANEFDLLQGQFVRSGWHGLVASASSSTGDSQAG